MLSPPHQAGLVPDIEVEPVDVEAAASPPHAHGPKGVDDPHRIRTRVRSSG